MLRFDMKADDMSTGQTTSTVHQEDDILPPRLLVYVILGVLVISFVLVAVAFAILRSSERYLRPSGQFSETSLGPIIERSNVYEDLFGQAGDGQILARVSRQTLHEYAWVDKEKRIVRIPIDIAVDLYVNSEAQ